MIFKEYLTHEIEDNEASLLHFFAIDLPTQLQQT